MAKFSIVGMNKKGQPKKFIYDNSTSELTYEDGRPVYVAPLETVDYGDWEAAFTVSKDTPANKSSEEISILKIVLGLSCNYSCEYCSQRFVPHAEETTQQDIEPFLRKIEHLAEPKILEFWGGEPLVYWKTLKPIAETLRLRWPNTQFHMITNGSLLDFEKNEWLDSLDFSISISHDGPGQPVRGPDPFEVPEQRAAIMDLYHRLRPKARISINAMINRKNKSRSDIQDWIIDATGDQQVAIGEGGFVDAYDEGGLENSLLPEEFLSFRWDAFQDIRQGNSKNFVLSKNRITEWLNSVANKRPSYVLGQKCGMDRPDSISVNLQGEVQTCQNISTAATAPNGEKHKIGDITDLENVKLNTATHWTHRTDCNSCPVLQVCKGSCMFLEGELWEKSCDNAYSDHIPFFAAAFEMMTGYFPVYIDGEFREDRKNLFGLVEVKPIDADQIQ